MSINSQQLAQRFREVTLNGKWIANTNYNNALSTINLTAANTKINDLNTIAVLAQHINYYIKGITQVFNGGQLDIRDKFSFDFPEIESESTWNNFKIDFNNNAENLAKLIESLPNNKLNTVFVDKKYGTYLRNIDGLIEHCYYHLGQIVLIKKLC